LRRGFDFSLLDPVCLPATPGSDLVGYIVQCGSQVEGFKLGDRVAALVKSGANARYISVPASSLVAVPRGVCSEEAVCMVSIYATAFKAIKMVCDNGGSDFSLKDKKVVVVGGCDPVGQALIHLCKKAKASIIYASVPTNRQGSVDRSFGVKPLPADAAEWPDEVKGKMDLVFDGESNDISGSKSALDGQGKLVIYGMSAMLKDKEMGVFGAPTSAHLARMGNSMRWSTQTLDIWESFQNDPKSYKVGSLHAC
jgi:NADPH:quinone reductase-like Zn-dependent oxidoreductase